MAAASVNFTPEEIHEGRMGMLIFWVAVLLWPLTLIVAGVLYGILYGFSAHKLEIIVVGVFVAVLDYIGITYGFDNRLWLIALVPYALVPIAVGIFCLEILRLNWLATRAKKRVEELNKK